MSQRTYIGMGTNLGDRTANLRTAVQEIAGFTHLQKVSPLYETAPVGFADQGPFLNAVVLVDTDFPPPRLLHELKAVEQRMGRTPGPRNGPRLIDLDILLMGTLEHARQPAVPHPRMHERAFVLRPLADLAPGLILPGRGRLADLLATLPQEGIHLWGESLDGPWTLV